MFDDVRYILFDWGGTLCAVDGEERAWEQGLAALLAAARAHGLPLGEHHTGSLLALYLKTRAESEADPEHREIVLEPVLARWLRDQGFADTPDSVLHALGEAYWAPWIGCLRVIGDANHTLPLLRQRGYRVGLVSNVTAPPSWCRRQLEHLGFWSLLDAVTLSSEIGVRKPHPRIYDDALQRIGRGASPPTHTVLFVGDAPQYDVAVPALMGMRTALVRDTTSRWPPDHYERANPDLTVDGVADLLPHLPGPP